MILALVLRFGTARYPRGTAQGIEAVRAFAGSRPTEIVVIDNALAPDARFVAGENLTVRGGDNEVREFTGWDAVLAERLHALRDDDLVVLVTDALRQGDVDHLDAISADAADHVSARSLAYGHLDAYGRPVELFGLSTPAWLRTSFVALSARTLRGLGPLTAVRPQHVFSSPDEPLSFVDGVPAVYRRDVTSWITGGALEGGHRYHSGLALSERATADFQVKATCIVNEHLLSARLVARGVRLLDMEWWSQRDVAGWCWPEVTDQLCVTQGAD